MRYPLRFKLLAAFFAILLIPLVQVAFYGYATTRREWVEQLHLRSQQEVYLQAEHLATALSQVQGDAVYLGQLLKQTLPSSDAMARSLEMGRNLQVLLSVRPMYRRVRILAADGAEMLRVESDGQRVNIARPDSATPNQIAQAAEAAQKLADKPSDAVYVSSFISEPASSPPIIGYGLKLGQGQIVLMDVQASWLLRNLPLANSQDAWALVDQRGVYMVYPEGAPASPNGRIHADYAPLLSGGRGYFEVSGQVLMYETLYPTSRPDQFWVLYHATPSSALYAEVDDFYTNSALLLLAGVFVAIALALFMGENIAAPILRLQRQAQEFGQRGTILPRHYRFSSDEIGALATAFYAMTDELVTKRRQEKRLIERLIRAQEEERKRVAYDLHDGLIQQLVGARLYLSQSQVAEPSAPDDNFRRGCAALSEAIVEGRRIIDGLRPGALDDLGLGEALRELAANAAHAAGWQVEYQLQAATDQLDHTSAVTLYRIAQEALNNARKHAQASHVRLSLIADEEGLTLSIEDDGRGVDLHSLRHSRGLGITTMHERAEQLGGLCEFFSQPGQGTRVLAFLPFSFNPADTAELQGV